MVNVYYYGNKDITKPAQEIRTARIPPSIKDKLSRITTLKPKSTKTDKLRTKSAVIAPSPKSVIALQKTSGKINKNENFKEAANTFVMPIGEMLNISDFGTKLSPESCNLNGIVRVVCCSPQTSPSEPWKIIGQQEMSSTGFAIRLAKDGEVLVMTNGHAVLGCKVNSHNKKIVTLFTHNNIPFTGEIVMEDDCTDLALIRPLGDPVELISDAAIEFEDPKSVLEESDIPALKTHLTIIGFPFGDKSPTETTGRITCVSSQLYALSGATGLIYTTDASVNEGNSGGPVLGDDGKLMGVVFQGRGQSSNCIIPRTVVESTIARYKIEADAGKPGPVFLTDLQMNIPLQSLIDTNIREFLAIDEAFSSLAIDAGMQRLGVRVKNLPEVLKDSKLLRNDVIYEINGNKVNSDCTFNLKETPLSIDVLDMFVTPQNPEVHIKLLRRIGNEWKPLEFSHTCREPFDLIPKKLCDKTDEYCVILGFPILGVKLDLVKSDIEHNQLIVDELSIFKNGYVSTGQKQVLMARSLFHNDYTQNLAGYEGAIIVEVNGRPVSSISDVIYSSHYPIEVNGVSYVTFKSADDDLMAIKLDKPFEKANEEALRQMGISGPGYSSHATSALQDRCGCSGNSLQFGSAGIVCSSCNSQLAAVKFEGGAISVLPHDPADAQRSPNGQLGRHVTSGKSTQIVME